MKSSYWKSIKTSLERGLKTCILYVVHSEGSSPGRQGFKMWVNENGEMGGTIGGGIMEHKLINLAIHFCKTGEEAIVLKKQEHDKDAESDRSGMICSGSQMVAMVPITEKRKSIVEDITAGKENWLIINQEEIKTQSQPMRIKEDRFFEKPNENQWSYFERVEAKPKMHIIGAGHVGLELSKMMNYLGFHVSIYDDRDHLNTLKANTNADEKVVLNYKQIGEMFSGKDNEYVAIVTFGYRSDYLVLKQLLAYDFKYLGMMGSAEKVAQIFDELRHDGFPESKIAKVHAPIGLNIFSRSSKEIAISIAGEIIRVKNRHLPSGRSIDQEVISKKHQE